MPVHLAAAVCLALQVPLLAGEQRAIFPLRAVSKAAASAAFVAYAFTSGALDAGWPGRLVVVALVLSVVGDLALLSRAKPAFLAGLGAFLLAHVAFVGAFVALGLDPIGLVGGVLVLAPFGIGVWRWLGPHTGSLRGAVLAYLLVILAMASAAISAFVAAPTLARGGLLAAALVFVASDLCVARDRFIAPGFPNRLVGLPLYYMAQLGFAGFVARAAAGG